MDELSIKILVIYQGKGFMSEALEDNLGKAGLEVVRMPPLIDRIGGELFDTNAVLLYAGDFVPSSRKLLETLRDVCTAEEIPLCVVGYDREVSFVEDVIPRSHTAYTFIRPFDMDTLVSTVKKLADASGRTKDKKSILLVDDDVIYLRTLIKFLSDKYEVTAVRAGVHALKFMQGHTPDLILLDYEMPVMNGPQTLEKIREKKETADIPVIFLTGKSDKDSVVNAMTMHPDGYLLKTMGKEELLSVVEGVLISDKWKKVLR